MKYDLSEEVRQRLETIENEGHSIFGLDVLVLAEGEYREPLSKVYGEDHLEELQEDLEEVVPEHLNPEPVYRSCEMRINQDGYVLAADIENMADLSK